MSLIIIFQHLTLTRDIIKSQFIKKPSLRNPYWKIRIFGHAIRLVGGPIRLQRFMNSALSDMSEYSSAYIDEVIVFSNSFEDHIKHLDKVLGRLNSQGLTVKPTKCQLAHKECILLGHRVGGGEVWPLEAKIECICKYPHPTKKKDMMVFFRIGNYYRWFVLNYASIAVPLMDST